MSHDSIGGVTVTTHVFPVPGGREFEARTCKTKD